MTNKLYVGNLPFSMTVPDLEKMFSEFGKVVSAVIITDRNSGRSKGFGFVEMENEEAAKKAMEALNGKEIEGRAMVVNEARPKPER
ncbi:RNA-binding protein [candidate division WWE3 bacterium CG_4_8_14_3_um_filter_42_11]|uniref:RNA-binding protein n=2 Tax=Katanobacteria TaxID=422282 RepID=A0A2M7TB46_UNCKA|nr:MAG: RNA-binding protein [bacterium CG1_02_42_9]PIZ42255.1 MAG: RNA-binding protein [candidate division WWE3 bacterium CG_4_10_14_0_2_um_filter_42_8]PJC69271.1 MAG: RNA-binding protein [candidate division WWE3 bacterium CG_4_8_14_3_um_filter_42_11]